MEGDRARHSRICGSTCGWTLAPTIVTIVGTESNTNVNETKNKIRERAWCEPGFVRTEVVVISRTSIRKSSSPVDWQYPIGQGEWRQ